MKRPEGIERLRFDEDHLGSGGVYPPLGFKPVWEAALGNGDYYGLYWPYGMEGREPMICDMIHDEGRLEVAFSSVGIFSRWLELSDGCRGAGEVADPELVTARFLQVRMKLHRGPEEAIPQLKSICEDFPEGADYWYALAGQLKRIGDDEGCGRAAVRAFASNWAFGMPPNGTVKLLQNARRLPALAADPLISRSMEIDLKFGGTKLNPIYDLMKECIQLYLGSEEPILGILLNQNYAYMMAMETTSFRERYGFVAEEWIAGHSELCKIHLGDSRRSIS